MGDGKTKSLFKKANGEEVEQRIRSKPLGEFFVSWDDIGSDDVRLLEDTLEAARNELELQEFLEDHPILLIQHLGGGHGRWVLSKTRLGTEHVTDFLLAERSSMGYEWQAVELESPTSPLFTKRGDPRHELTHAIRQIRDWRNWLEQNLAYARRRKEREGLGLIDISPSLKGLVVIGRRASIDPNTDLLRRRISKETNIEIHTYDWLLDQVKGRCEAIGNWKGKGP